MTSTEQIMEKRDDDVDDGISCGVERNRFRKLPTIYKMTSTEQTMKKRDDGVDDELAVVWKEIDLKDCLQYIK